MKIIQGNAINRYYKYSKKSMIKGIVGLGVSLPMAGLNAHTKDALGTGMWGLACFTSVKLIELSKRRMLFLQDSYKAIVDRAKAIKAAKK